MIILALCNFSLYAGNLNNSITLENAGAEQSQEMWAGTVTKEVKCQSFPGRDSSAMLF